MSDRTRPRFVDETPIERIFEKVMHRKNDPRGETRFSSRSYQKQ